MQPENNMTTQVAFGDLPPAVRAEFERDARIVRVRHYTDGFVPMAYRYRAPGAFAEWTCNGDTSYTMRTGEYDRKRSNGKGRTLVAYSAKGGAL